MIVAILLVGLAFLLVMAELMFPSFGILSLLAFTAYGFAIAEGFESSSRAGWTILVLGMALLPLAILLGLKVLPHTPMGKRLFLRAAKSTETAYQQAAHSLLGATGVAETRLRPSGTVRFGEQRVSVVTDGEFIEAGTSVRVISVDGIKIVVEVAAPPFQDAPGGDQPSASPTSD